MYNIQFLVLDELKGSEYKHLKEGGLFDYRTDHHWIDWRSDLKSLEEVVEEFTLMVNSGIIEPRTMLYRVKEYK